MSEESVLVPPHGGVLVDRFAGPAEVEAIRLRARSLPRLPLDAVELADLELIATGAASPLTGFLGARDYRSVVRDLRLADGTVWPLPLTLSVGADAAARLGSGLEAALVDDAGSLRGTIAIDTVFRRDIREEARLVYGTEDSAHPGVAALRRRPEWLVGGSVTALPLPDDRPFRERRLTPRALRAEIAARGWRTVAGFQTRNPIHRAHEYLTKVALELTDGLVLHPLVGETKGDDVPAETRFRVYEALLAGYYPADRTILAAFPAAMRYAGPREALFHALVRKNYGVTHFIVGRDHAGVGSYYAPRAAQEIFDRFAPEELGVTPLRFDPAFWCRACGSTASAKTCPHAGSSRLELSGTKVRQILAAGGTLPAEFTRPETAAILRSGGVRPDAPATPAASRAEAPRFAGKPAPRGFIVWLTGLSGAGKSTLAEALRERLEREGALEILDGDEVRTHLSKGLGFSREDRDTNVARIGWVARRLARHGAGVVTAAISPYAAAREDVRRQAADDGIPFLEVHVKADLAVLVDRDVKGLYRKALAGELAHFTGVSDPYEDPISPDVVVRSDAEPVEVSRDRVLDALRQRGLLADPGAEEAVA